MKKIPLLFTLAILVGMFLLTTQAFAGPINSVDAMPTQAQHTPGPQATHGPPSTPPGLVHKPAAAPGQPTFQHVVGWVTEYSEGSSITILGHDGNTYTFALSEDTKILPKGRADELEIGSRVTIIAPRLPASADWSALGIVVHPAGSGAGSAPPTGTPTTAPTPTETPTPFIVTPIL